MIHDINISMLPTSKDAACMRFIGLRALLDNLLASGVCGDFAFIKDFALDGSTYVVECDTDNLQAVIDALDHTARVTAHGSAAPIIDPTGEGVNPSALLSALKTPR